MGKTWGMVESGYRQLIVMRHAKTEQTAGSDRLRRLTSRGRADAKAAGRWLDDHDLAPDLVLSSPAARARETADIVAAALGGEPEIRTVDSLYGADADDVVELVGLAGSNIRIILVAGHNPTMGELAHRLQRDAADPWAPHLPTAGLAILSVPGDWADLTLGSTELTHWHVPRG